MTALRRMTESMVPLNGYGTPSCWRWLMCVTKLGTQWPPNDSPAKWRGLVETGGNISVKKMRRKAFMSLAASSMLSGPPFSDVEKPTPAGLLRLSHFNY